MADSLCPELWGARNNVFEALTESMKKQKDGTKHGNQDLFSLCYLSCFLIVGVTPLLHLTIPANLMPERKESHWIS